MNYLRLGLAAISALVASFAVGFLIMGLAPALLEEAHKYPSVFRPKEEMFKVMPVGIGGHFIAILIVAIIFAMIHRGRSGVTYGATNGALLGVLIGIFVLCTELQNFANFNIGLNLALGRAAAYFVQWTVIGIVIGLIYKPLSTP
jgi:hypothetical protein